MKTYYGLIIEDEPELADSFATVLSMQGIYTEVILDGQEALNVLETNSPDIVLLDINLPKVSGDQILSFIRSSEHLKHCKVLIASANPQVAMNLVDSADLILIKPVGIDQLVTFTERMILMVESEIGT